MVNQEKQTKVQGGGKKPFWKKWWFWVIVVVIVGVMLAGSSEDEEKPQGDAAASAGGQVHIYDNAVIKDVMNGSRSEKIGEYSVIEITADKVTEDSLTDWYFNYVEKNAFNWYAILYTDKQGANGTFEGVQANQGIVNVGVLYGQDEYGDYEVTDLSKCDVYVPNDGKLKKLELSGGDNAQAGVESEKSADDVPTEYKSALRSAEAYSETMHMSKAAIYDQLTSEYGDKFTSEAAQYAIDNIQADWNKNALESAKVYQDMMAMSPAAIYDQLIADYGDKFTETEAQYAVDNLK